MATAKQLDYAPSAAARTLVKQSSQLIGVILYTGHEHPDIQHPFFQEVLVGLKHGIGALGYDLLLFATEQPGSNSGKPHSYLRRVRHHRVDGVVLMGVDASDPEVQKLLASETPIIGVDLDIAGPRASYVTSDNVTGARLAVRHLHSLGHTRIATISGPSDTKAGGDRSIGYRAEMQALGLEVLPGYEQEGDFYAESGEAGDARAARARPAPDRGLRRVRHDGRRRAEGASRRRRSLPGGRRGRRLRRHRPGRAPQPGDDDDPAGRRPAWGSPPGAR